MDRLVYFPNMWHNNPRKGLDKRQFFPCKVDPVSLFEIILSTLVM